MKLLFEGINKSFSNNHVLKDLSFEAESGKAFGLLGRNGSGKTTTIRIIMDIFPQDSGRVTIDGRGMKDFINKVGYLPEERGLYPKRIILEQMVYLGVLRGLKPAQAKKNAETLLGKLDASEYLKRKLDTLSKGNQQKIQLAIALITEPDILILDEPFSGLDPVNANTLKSLVTEMVEKGKLVIFSSHQMSSVEEFCDDICIINKGESVLSGNLKRIKKTYPRNKILITPDAENIDTFVRKLNESPEVKALASEVIKSKHGCSVTLRDDGMKARLYGAVNGLGLGMDSFRVLEPTLEEIFIEKVGRSDEPESIKDSAPPPKKGFGAIFGNGGRR